MIEKMTETIDIIMLCYNHLDATKKALKSLIETTHYKRFRLFIYNNASTDGTKEYLDRFTRTHLYNNITIINSKENKGWIKAIHDTYNHFTNNYFLTCHNDVVFEKDWLDKMLNCFDKDETCAAVGPVSDFVLGLQSVNYNVTGIYREKVKFVVGLFCLFKKSAIDHLIQTDGYFMDMQFGLGDKEEHDYWIRLGKLGYCGYIARNVFIHHDGERGFADVCGGKDKFHEYQNKNNELLIAKWGKDTVNSLFTVDLAKRLTIGMGVITRGDSWHEEYGESFVMLQKFGYWHNFKVRRSIITEARELIVEEALKCNCDYVLFIDDDMVFPSDAALKLIKHDVDIVSGLAFQRIEPYLPCVFTMGVHHDNSNDLRTELYMIELFNQGLREVDATGMAFTLIRTEVFRRMPKPWFVWHDRSLGIYADKGGLGEDIAFCIKAKRLGFKVYCDTDLIINHLGDRKQVNDKTYLEYKVLNEIKKDFALPKETTTLDILTEFKQLKAINIANIENDRIA